MRALGVPLVGLSRKSLERRPYPPGQHGLSRKRKASDYKMRLQEKQKIRAYYGITETQLRNSMALANRKADNPGHKLIEMLESRIDNVLFRAGFARTIPAARQLVVHGHFRVNGKRVDVPGFKVRANDVITLRPKSENLEVVANSILEPVGMLPPWLNVDNDKKTIQVTGAAGAESSLLALDVRLVVEYYAQRG